jgi:hypothetical protein
VTGKRLVNKARKPVRYKGGGQCRCRTPEPTHGGAPYGLAHCGRCGRLLAALSGVLRSDEAAVDLGPTDGLAARETGGDSRE